LHEKSTGQVSLFSLLPWGSLINGNKKGAPYYKNSTIPWTIPFIYKDTLESLFLWMVDFFILPIFSMLVCLQETVKNLMYLHRPIWNRFPFWLKCGILVQLCWCL